MPVPIIGMIQWTLPAADHPYQLNQKMVSDKKYVELSRKELTKYQWEREAIQKIVREYAFLVYLRLHSSRRAKNIYIYDVMLNCEGRSLHIYISDRKIWLQLL